jgi:hypothetical protein
MEKFKIKSFLQTEIETEVTLPYYLMAYCHCYKIVSETICIQVLFSSLECLGSINIVNPQVALSNIDSKECKEIEFEEKYDFVIDKLLKIKNGNS